MREWARPNGGNRPASTHRLNEQEMRMKPTCSILECDREARTRGWCQMHYKRWRTHGDPTVVKPPGKPRACCRICGEPANARQLCNGHYLRWFRGVDPEAPLTGPGSPKWHGREAVTYDAVHERLRRLRGPAKGLDCVGCGVPAEQWAYQHTDPAPLVSTDEPSIGCEYSDDLSAYAPMCRPCHTALDRKWRERIVNGDEEVAG